MSSSMRFSGAWVKFVLVLLGCFFAVSLLQARADTGTSPKPVSQKRVVLINSYHKGYLWSDEITRGVEETLSRRGVDLHIEYLDTKRQNNDAYLNLLSDLMYLKYGRQPYDVVITSDNNAFNFFSMRGEQIFRNTPHVFCGVNYLRRQDLEGVKHTTGVNERADIAGNLTLIRRLHPDCRKIIVITDNTTTGKRIQSEVKRLISRRRYAEAKLELLYDVSAAELIDSVKNFGPRTIILLTFFFRDNTGAFFEYDQGAEMVCDNARVPVYGAWDFLFHHGIVGGYLVSGYDQGVLAAEKALSILAGQKAEDIPVQYETPTRLRFDYRQLKRHGISLDLLPPDSQVWYQPVSFYSQYKKGIWITISVFCLLLLGFLGLAYGLLRSRQMERKLRRNEENLSTTLHSIGDAVIVTDAAGDILRMNPVAEKLTGWRLEEAKGESFWDVFHIIHAKTRESAGNPVEKVLSASRILSMDEHTMLISRDGSEYHIADSGAPIRGADGNIIGVVLVFQDVTEEYELREQYRNMSFIVESASNPIVMFSLEGGLSHVNPAFLKTWGYDRPDEALGHSIAEFWMIGENLTEIINTIKSEGIASEEVKARKRDGSYFDVQVSAAAVRDNTGQPVALMASSFDITRRKELEAQLRQSQKMDAIGLLAGGVAHDFNNMLAGIMGAAELVKGSDDLSEEDAQYIDMIIQSAILAADLTSKLLTFSRKGRLLSVPLDVHAIINDTVGILERSIDKKNQLNLDLKAADYVINGDNSQLQNLLMNLCINSSHAMPEGGEIFIQTRNLRLDEIYCQDSPFDISPGEFIVIEVRDTGCGIPQENLQKIFEPFFTTKKQGKGTGLGLSAVYGIVKSHHGSVTVYSESGAGTVFHIFLPVSGDKADLFVGSEAIIRGAGTILLVDDEEFVRITAKAMLTDMGYHVLLAENGQAGVDIFKKQYRKIDLVILDMIMPVMNGREAYEKMKVIDENIKAVISSGFSKPDDLTELRKIGLAGFIWKPYFKVELSQLVADVLSGKRR